MLAAEEDGMSASLVACRQLGVVFVCAKIFAIEPVAHWSWWWVTAPFWGVFVLQALATPALKSMARYEKRRWPGGR
jgi:small Trp-rich protein